MTARSTHQHDQQMIRLADESMARHVIVSREHTRATWAYVIARPGSGIYLAEIRRVYGGRILVSGDIAGSLFQGSGEDDVLATLRWLSGADASYIASKVHLGERETIDNDVAIHWLRERVSEDLDRRDRETLEDADDLRAHVESEMSVAAREAIQIVQDGGGVAEARRHIYEKTGEAEWSCRLGVVVSPDVYYSMAACRKLLSLLLAEDAVQEDPEP